MKKTNPEPQVHQHAKLTSKTCPQVSFSNEMEQPEETKTQNTLPPNKRPTYKIIVVGDSGVGKTCLTYRFCSGKFPSTSTDATIGVDFREKIVVIESCDVRLQLWDTAGQERFRKSMVAHYYRNVSAVVFVYDVTSNSSFDGLVHWIDECHKHGLSTHEVPMIVVGNKCDSTELPTQVQTSIAQRFADDHGMPLFETSAKDDSRADHVEAIFLTLAHKIRNNQTLFKTAKQDHGEQTPDGKNVVRIIHRNEAMNDSDPSYCCF